MKTNLISLILLGLITTGLVTGGVQYLNSPEKKVDNTYVQTKDGQPEIPSSMAEVVEPTVNATLTEAEVLEIANSLPEVQEFIANYNAVGYAYYDGFGLWQVEYYQNGTTSLDGAAYLIVLIEDATGEVLDIYAGYDWGYVDPSLLENATTYLFSTMFVAEDRNDFVIYGDAFGSELYVSGYSEITYNWFSASMTVSGDDFSINSVSADFQFGDTVHSFDEALQIVLSTPEGKNFTSDINFTSYVTENAYFDGTQMFYSFSITLTESWGDVVVAEPLPPENGTDASVQPVEPIDPVYPGSDVYWGSSYLYAEVDDATGQILYLYYEEPYVAQSTEEEVLAVALAITEIQNWTSTVGEYEYYLDFWDGLWYVSLNNLNYTAWAWVTIEDGTLEVLDYYASVPSPATMSEEDVRGVADQAGLSEFLATYAAYNLTVSVLYDGFGTWEVFAYSPIYVELFFYVLIDDLTGEVIYQDQMVFDFPPTMDVSDVIAIILSTDNYTDFLSTYPNATIHVFYIGGLWYIDVYEEVDNSLYFTSAEVLSFIIDDATGDILEVSIYVGGYAEGGEGNY